MTWTWNLHNRLIHPACSALRRVGLKKLSFRLHDATVPDHTSDLWDAIGSKMEFRKGVKLPKGGSCDA